MKNKKRIIILSSIILGMLIVCLGITYSVYTFNKQGTKIAELVTGDIYMHYTEKNGINLQNAFPQKDLSFEAITTYTYNENATNEEKLACVSYFEDFMNGVELEEGENLYDYCSGTGTVFGNSLQDDIDNGIPSNVMFSLLEMNILDSNIDDYPYFEFEISGVNTNMEKDIWYDISLLYGDEIEGKSERISDYLLRFTLIEYDEDRIVPVFSNYSYDAIDNLRIWSDIISNNTNEEIVKKYRLYMWISEDTNICGGNSDENCNYFIDKTPSWNDVFASVKVKVTGDFEEKNVYHNILPIDLLYDIPISKNKISKINFLKLTDEEIQISQENAIYMSDINGYILPCNISRWVEIDQARSNSYSNYYILNIASPDTIYCPRNSSNMFSDYYYLQHISFDNIDTSRVTNMSHMFSNCSDLIDLDVSNFDTSNVTDMSYMFWGGRSLAANISDNSVTIDLSNFDTSNVISMSYMFANSEYGIKKLDLSNFDTSKVTDMSGMFDTSYAITVLDVSNFDTSNVTNMAWMFAGPNLNSLDVSNFDTSKVTDMSSMFAGLNVSSLDVSNFDTSNVTNIKSMFSGCSGLTELDVSNFDTSKVTNMSGMFSSCSSLTELDVSNFNTSQVKDMSWMFSDCSSLTSLGVSFDTSKVTSMWYMFSGCSSLTELDVTNFDTGNVTNMCSMFAGLNVSSLNISNFDTSNVTDMSSMFSGCSSLAEIDVSNFDTSNVTDMRGMFYNCSSLISLDLSNFDTSNVQIMGVLFSSGYGMFEGCSNLVNLDISDFNLSSSNTILKYYGRVFSSLPATCQVKVKDLDAQTWILNLTSSNRPSSWSTSNVKVKN